MKFRTWIKCLFWNLMALWIIWSFTDSEKADLLFRCLLGLLCDKTTFRYLRDCWLILAAETKDVVQTCTLKNCGIYLPDYFSMDDVCNDHLTYDNKKRCFIMCTQALMDHVEKLQKNPAFSLVYESALQSGNCLEPVLRPCITL
ncbi:uncharacterized protein LOC118195140 isoform X1 [Stegodyphus dumicola]|uniref:uncharacterized protein LOC118195140 isoform X1 n=1 Tax=Stegodyphus dumicola TaxID=202533 RepID=UPI0015A8E974|nr:uncharacterized protein LOC118195140 isoform X1 [Stegodyphus dumicola]